MGVCVNLLSSFVQPALFSLVFCFVCVPALCIQTHETNNASLCASCAYCCRCVSVPSLISTRCKVETIATYRVPCICTRLTLWPFLLPLTPSSSSSRLDLWPLQHWLVGLSCQDMAGCAPSQTVTLFLTVVRRRVNPHYRTKQQYNLITYFPLHPQLSQGQAN